MLGRHESVSLAPGGTRWSCLVLEGTGRLDAAEKDPSACRGWFGKTRRNTRWETSPSSTIRWDEFPRSLSSHVGLEMQLELLTLGTTLNRKSKCRCKSRRGALGG